MALGEIAGVVRKVMGTRVYYFGTVMSDKAKGVTFVPVIERSTRTYLQESDEGGYQRPGSRSRMRAFMRFLAEHPNSVVPPVLLSIRQWWRFVPDQDRPDYGLLVVENPAAIVDGQHRVGGYIALFEEESQVRPIDFIALQDLTREDEVQEFVTVNSTQKGVPKALTTFLGDEMEARIAWALNEEEDSPFRGRITRTQMSREVLFALNSVAKGIKRLFNHGKLVDLGEDARLDCAMRYWTIIADELEEPWSDIEKLGDVNTAGRADFEYKLLELTGYIAWSLMGPDVLSRSYAEGVGVNWENVRALVRACGSIDWRKQGQYEGRTGEAGALALKQDMERLLPVAVVTDIG